MRVNNALSADELDDGWVLTCQSIPTSAEVVVDYDALIGPFRARGVRAPGTAKRGRPSVRSRDSMRASRSVPSGSTRTARSVTPASRKLRSRVDDRRLVAGREEVADVGRVAVLEQALVVRRVLGVPERLVRPRARGVDLVVARTARPGRRRRRAARVGRPRPAAFVMRGTHVVADRALVGHPEDRARRQLARDAQHHRRERGEEDRRRGDVGDVERVVHAVVVVLDVDRARAGERGVQHLEVVAHEARGPLVRQAEHVGDDPVVRRTEAEREAAFAHRLVRQRLLRHRDRVAGLDRHHRGAELDRATSRWPISAIAVERVEVVRDLGHPDRREAGLLGRLARRRRACATLSR